jgi:hypothetical protein
LTTILSSHARNEAPGLNPAERPEGARKRFLGRVFGLLAIVQDDISGCQGLVLVSRDKLSVGVEIAASRALDELGMSGVGCKPASEIAHDRVT